MPKVVRKSFAAENTRSEFALGGDQITSHTVNRFRVRTKSKPEAAVAPENISDFSQNKLKNKDGYKVSLIIITI